MAEKQVPSFVYEGKLTAEGAKLKSFIEAQLTEAKDSVDALNRLTGTFKHYYVNVARLGTMTPERWLEDYGRSFAREAWHIMEHVALQEAQAQAVVEAGQKSNDVAAQLEAFKEELGKKLAKLERENKALKKQVKALEATEVEAEIPSEVIADDAETEEDDAETEEDDGEEAE